MEKAHKQIPYENWVFKFLKNKIYHIHSKSIIQPLSKKKDFNQLVSVEFKIYQNSNVETESTRISQTLSTMIYK